MTAQTRSLMAGIRAEPGANTRILEWIVATLLIFNVIYAGVVVVWLTPSAGAASALGCEESSHLPTQPCYWLKGLPLPGTASSTEEVFLPVDTPEASAGRTFGLVMLALVAISLIGLWRGTNWRNWAVAITVAIALLSWGRWATIPISFAGVGQILALLFVISMIALSGAGAYGLLNQAGWARSLLVAAGAYATLIGAIWVAEPVALFQVMVGILLVLTMLERQGTRRPQLGARIVSWTFVPVLVFAALLATNFALIAPASGISANTLNWQTIFQRTLEHMKVVLVASLIAIATAVPAGILITRDYKFSMRTRRIFTAVPQAILIGLGYAIPWLVAWWFQDPVAIASPGDLLRALSGPIFWALIMGGGIHWLIYSQTRARPDWGAIDSWRSLGPVAINIANVGQTVPSLAVLGLSMSFLGIGFVPAIFALWIRALLPILRNTVAGILSVDPDIVEAAQGMGMTRRQVLLRIELPLAMAVIFAGIRTAVVFNIGVGALAFYIGAGGLGHLIAIGIALSAEDILLAGGILTALMAIAADFVMEHIEDRLVPPTV
jgi:osmoprotectant transport system permease protein